MTTETGHGPVPASVLSLRLRGGGDDARKLAARRQRLVDLAHKVLAGWPQERRVVLDAPDGLAFVGEIAPSVALRAAATAARCAGDASLGIALHHGMVHV